MLPPFDIIIGSDIVYNKETFVSLKETIESLSSDNTEILLSYKQRTSDEEQFFRLISESWNIDKVKHINI